MNTMLTHLDLFSGIGGFALAAQWTRSIRTVAFCEVDEYCVKVLNKNFTGVPVYGDITQEREWPQADIITGGFPCQPFSVAGTQKGTSDERHLWPAMLGVINTVRPTWIIGENVAGIKKLALDLILSDLDSNGYDSQAFNIPAAGIGAPHKRERIWIVAHTASTRGQPKPTSIHKNASKKKPEAERHKQFVGSSTHMAYPTRNRVEESQRQNGEQNEGSTRQGGLDAIGSGTHVAHTNLTRQQERGRGDGTRRGQASEGQVRRADRRGESQGDVQRDAQSRLGGETDGLSGWLDGSWERGVPRVKPTEHDRKNRLHAIGNAIVPQVAYQILKGIVEIEGAV